MSCSSDDQSDKECPLCMEVLEIDDVDFYPCKCEYQICRFCWHRLKNDENGLCPACRQPYPEDPVNFKPLSTADLQRIKDEKKMKQQAEKMRISESRKHLANYRVLQKNLVYAVGLSTRFANEDTLRKQEFFGRFGKIQKIVLGTTPNSSLPSHLQPSHTAYITYNRVDEALRAIQGVNNTTLDGRTIKASLGTTKYCSSFLRSQTCGKPECMYLHDTAENDISFTKEDMHAGKHSEYERRLIETMISKRQAFERRQLVNSNNKTAYDQNERGDNLDDSLGDTCNGEQEGMPIDHFDTKERQDSQEKENHDSNGTMASPPTRITNNSPTPVESLSSESSAFFPEDDQPITYPDPELQEEEIVPKVALTAPPGLTTPIVSCSEQTTSRLLRLMNLSEGSGQGSVPAPAPQEEAPAPLANWQTLLGLVPPTPVLPEPAKTKRVPTPPPGLNPFDDDLGFDPFSESTKGLAKLLEEERVRHPMPQTSLFNNNRTSLHDLWAPPTSAFGGLGHTRSHQHFTSSLATTPFDLFGLAHSSQMNGGFSNGVHQPPPSQYNDFHMHHSHHPVSSHNSYAPPPGLSAPTRHSQPAQQVQPQSITEWQEGLKALLPNVNVRFAADLEQQASQRWQPSSSSSGSYSSLHQSLLPHSVPPPPGFSIPNR